MREQKQNKRMLNYKLDLDYRFKKAGITEKTDVPKDK